MPGGGRCPLPGTMLGQGWQDGAHRGGAGRRVLSRGSSHRPRWQRALEAPAAAAAAPEHPVTPSWSLADGFMLMEKVHLGPLHPLPREVITARGNVGHVALLWSSGEPGSRLHRSSAARQRLRQDAGSGAGREASARALPAADGRSWREQRQRPHGHRQWGVPRGAAPAEPSPPQGPPGLPAAGRHARASPPQRKKSDGAVTRSEIIIGSSQLGLPARCFLFKAS